MRLVFLDDVCDDERALPPPGDAVTVEDVEFRKDDARLESTEPLREIVDDEGPEGGGSSPGCYIPSFAAVKSADDLPLGELEGGGIVLMRWGKNRSVAKELKACSDQPERRVGISETHHIECDP